jgi:hypothetical protein
MNKYIATSGQHSFSFCEEEDFESQAKPDTKYQIKIEEDSCPVCKRLFKSFDINQGTVFKFIELTEKIDDEDKLRVLAYLDAFPWTRLKDLSEFENIDREVTILWGGSFPKDFADYLISNPNDFLPEVPQNIRHLMDLDKVLKEVDLPFFFLEKRCYFYRISD